MKKIMKPFVLVAAAAMALASCQKNEIPAPEKETVHFTVNAGIETKTSIVEGTDDEGNTVYNAQWDGNEELGLLFAAPGKDTEAKDVAKLTNAKSGKVASFQGNVTVEGAAGTFYAFYPASAFNRGYEEGDARLDLKNVQKPTATSFDPTCDILVAKPYDYVVEEGAVVADGLEFARIMSVLRIDLKSEFEDVQNEFVESVSFTAGDVKITGYARIFLENPKFDKWASSGDQWCTVTANYDSDLVSINGDSKSVYLVIAPVTIPANKDLTFEIKTKNYNISKTVKSPEMKFTAGKVSKLNLTIKEENCEKVDVTVDYSGEWLITGVKDSQTYAVSAYVDGNNLDVLVPITITEEKITEVDGLAACKMTITKVSTEGYAGLYTIEDSNSSEQKRSYLYAAGTGTNNHLKASSTLSAGSYWDITKNENGTYTIIASKPTTDRNTIWFNTSNNIFSCYQSNATSYKQITLYPYSMVVPDTTPRISVAETAYAISATDTSVEIPYTVKNITGKITATVADGATMTNVKATVADDKVTVTFDANTESTQKTATIVLSYEGAEAKEIVITQEPAGQTKQYYVKVTTAPTDWSGTYLMVCESKNMALSSISTTSTKYGIGSSVTISDGKIEATDANTSWQVVISKASVTSGAYKMAFAGKYLYWTSGNSLTTNASEVKNANWNISITNATLTISNCGTSTRQIMWNASSPRFACYEGGQTPIQLYRLEGGDTPEPDQPETPVEPIQLSAPSVQCSAADITKTSLKFTWDAVENASKYEVTFNGTTETITNTYYEATGLTANTKYLISVKAVGDGVNYTTSDACTAEGTTKAEQQSGGDEKVPSTTACYTFNTSSKTGGDSGYATASDLTYDNITWNATGNTTMAPWRIGGKSLNNTDRNVYSKTAYSSELSKIEFVSGTVGLTWNSLTLEYSTNKDFTNSTAIVVSSGLGANKTIAFAPEEGFPANCYFRFKINVTNTSTSNKYMQLSAIRFYGYEN